MSREETGPGRGWGRTESTAFRRCATRYLRDHRWRSPLGRRLLKLRYSSSAVNRRQTNALRSPPDGTSELTQGIISRRVHESAFHRYKRAFGRGLQARAEDGQLDVVLTGCRILNRMFELGKPESVAVRT